jgi:hypothetical protein
MPYCNEANVRFVCSEPFVYVGIVDLCGRRKRKLGGERCGWGLRRWCRVHDQVWVNVVLFHASEE